MKKACMFVALLVGAVAPVRAHEAKPGEPPKAEESEQETQQALAKKLSNPVADLVSIPFQANWQQGVGADGATQFILNIQPVIPFTLSKSLNLIVRSITPIIGQPPLVPGGTSVSDLGDNFTSFFFSPVKSKIIWGLGPAFSLPTSDNPSLGTGKWEAGPTFVVLKQSKGWTYGMLWNWVWSFAGDANRSDVSAMFTQPFVAYTTKKSYTITLNSEASTNFEAESGQKWTIPINLMLSKLSWFGPFPASYQVGLGYYVESPTGGPDWKLRVAFVLLLPRKH